MYKAQDPPRFFAPAQYITQICKPGPHMPSRSTAAGGYWGLVYDPDQAAAPATPPLAPEAVRWVELQLSMSNDNNKALQPPTMQGIKRSSGLC